MTEWEDAARIVFPASDRGADLSILPLYALDWTHPVQKKELFDPALAARPLSLPSLQGRRAFQAVPLPTFKGFWVGSRRMIGVNPGRAVSLCTFFNAFPAGYWARFTDTKSVRLSFTVSGKGVVEVWKSDAAGRDSRLWREPFEGDASFSPAFGIGGMAEGGYLWLDIHAEEASILDGASWQVPASFAKARQDACITTFNSPRSAARAIGAAGRAGSVKKVFCIDQGSSAAMKDPAFASAARALPGLEYIRQKNLGGAGGFARGMREAMKGEDEYFVLMDDDAFPEGETLERIDEFQKHCSSPVIVGAGMLHSDSPSSLFTFGEVINWEKIWYAPSLDLGYNHDFSALPLRESPRLHRLCTEDYNGWWLCSVPRRVAEKIGLPLPVFIKFDDIEYGLRAKKAAIPSISLPGAAVWHPAWHLKDQTRGWVEYFAERNRFLTALLYKDRPSGIFEASLRDQSNLGIRMEYASMALRNMALRDLLSGPEAILDGQRSKRREAEEVRRSIDPPALPPSALPLPSLQVPDPCGIPRICRAKKAALGLLNAALSCGAGPLREISSTDSWISLAGCSAAEVYDGKGKARLLKKNAPLFRRLYLENIRLTAELVKNWPSLSKSYREADLGSVKIWDSIFSRL
ncbi:MAG: glycosyltransferase [Aeriscardovia sp.]|nr:glycosyltransferase [Aeriscardovia sp.]